MVKTISFTMTQLAIAFIIFLVCVSPFVRIVGFGIAFTFGMALMLALVGGAFFLDMIRADSPTLITYTGLRKPRGSVESFIKTGPDANLPAMSILGYGGVRFFNVNSADYCVMAVPDESVESLNETVSLVYSPDVPLKRPKALAGILSSEADILSRMQDTNFDPDKKKCEARIGVLNALLEQPTSDRMREVQTFVDRSAMQIAETRDKPRIGEEANIQAIRQLGQTLRKQPALSVIKNFFTGTDDDRPPETNPYQEDEKK